MAKIATSLSEYAVYVLPIVAGIFFWLLGKAGETRDLAEFLGMRKINFVPSKKTISVAMKILGAGMVIIAQFWAFHLMRIDRDHLKQELGEAKSLAQILERQVQMSDLSPILRELTEDLERRSLPEMARNLADDLDAFLVEFESREPKAPQDVAGYSDLIEAERDSLFDQYRDGIVNKYAWFRREYRSKYWARVEAMLSEFSSVDISGVQKDGINSRSTRISPTNPLGVQAIILDLRSMAEIHEARGL